MKLFTLKLGLLILPFSAFAQNVCQNPDNVLDNRCEGTVSLNVGAGFEPVALMGYRLSAYEPGDNLEIHFYQPADGETNLFARKLRKSGVNYEMAPHQTDWQKGWNSFGPWSVDQFLVSHNIPARQLGVRIRTKDKMLLPAILRKQGTDVGHTDTYRLYLDTPTTIVRMTYTVKGPDGKTIYSGETEDEDAFTIFNIKVKMPADAKAGKYTIAMDVDWISGPDSLIPLTFYHQP